MTNKCFIGDGSEVLACEAYDANAHAEMKRLEQAGHENLSLYSLDPSSIVRDSSSVIGEWVWEFPAERAMAERDYELPSMREAIALWNKQCHDELATRLF